MGGKVSTPSGSRNGFLQIVAHPDDDLFFMSPELHATLASGDPSTTVYLAAGDLQDMPRRRQAGLKSAYAAACGVASAWTKSMRTFASGAQAEVYTLDARPSVALVFLNLRDQASLPSLGSDTAGFSTVTVNPDWFTDNGGNCPDVVPTQTGTGNGTDGTYTHTRATVVAALRELLDAYYPAALRTLDPVPLGDDHADHTGAAKLALAAAAVHNSGSDGRLLVASYRGYNIGTLPYNIGAAELAIKRDKLDIYIAAAHCAGGSATWLEPMYPRWSRGSNWVTANQDGTLMAFAASVDKVLVWRQAANGTWSRAADLAAIGHPIAPTLCVGHNADGRLQVVVRTLDTDDILTLHQTSVNGQFASSWFNFGNPNGPAGSANRNKVGCPILVNNQDGGLQLFVKNGGGGVSTLYQDDAVSGHWNLAWTDILGAGIQDGLSAVLNGFGRIELFGTSVDANRVGRIATWYQSSPKGGFSYNGQLGTANGGVVATVGSTPVARRNADGRMQVFFRQGGTNPDGAPGANGVISDVGVLTQIQVAGAWQPGSASLGGPGGTREIGALSTQVSGRIMLFARNSTGGVSVNWQTAANGGYGSWTPIDSVLVDSPAAAVGPGGTTNLLHIGTDGILYVATAAAGSTTFGSWSPVG